MTNKSLIKISLLLLTSCHLTAKHSIIISGQRVEGVFGRNMSFEGHMKFYDSATNYLIAEADYLNGLQNGEYKKYNNKGIVIQTVSYSDGKENGIAKYFDSSGIISHEDFYYYGLRSGNSVKYLNGKLHSYTFNSLDNQNLIYFEYDSLKKKRLPELLKNFFFFTRANFHFIRDTSAVNRGEYFLYTPNPPMQEFRFSLVRVDSSLKILSTIIEFDKNKPWSKFDYDYNWIVSKELVAIKLLVIDSINSGKITMLKVLK